jgi:energy-coupling factor transporter ATP-binding protein EcfA2
MNEQQARLDALVARIEKHQAALRLKDYPFAARYQRHLGSGKTWTDRLRTRNWKELGTRLDKWETKLNAFVAEIETGSSIEQVFENMPMVAYVRDAYEMLQGQHNDRRCVLVIGPTGTGKSVTLQRLAAAHPQHVVYIRFWRGMNESLRLIAAALAEALNCTVEVSGAATFLNVIKTLRGTPSTVIIEDIHEGGVLALKLVKTLIDESKAKFILSTYPTAYRRLVNGGTEAMAEAQQLLGRTIKPVNQQWVRGVGAPDIAVYLLSTAGLAPDVAMATARGLVQPVRQNGNLRLLADAVELARLNAEDNDADLTPEYIEASVLELCKKSDQEDQS